MVMPAVSSSMVWSVAVAVSVPAYPPVLDAVAVIVVVISPSTRLSSTPVTVMLWGASQLAVVKVSEEVLSSCSVLSSPEMAMVTESVGWASRTTVKEADVPPSVVTRGVLV